MNRQPDASTDQHDSALGKIIDRFRAGASEWVSGQLGAALAIVSTVGFLLGGFTLYAFARGMGLAPADFGLEFRAVVTLAAGSILIPSLFLCIYLLKLGKVLLPMSYVLVSIFGCWWLGLHILPALVTGLASGLVAWLFTLIGKSGETERIAVLLAVFGYGAAVPFIAFMSASALRHDEDPRIPGSSGSLRIVEFIMPVTRGVVTVEKRSTCVDRVGTLVMLTDAAPIVLGESHNFVAVDCERGEVPPPFSAATGGLVGETTATTLSPND